MNGLNDFWMTVHHLVMVASFVQGLYYDNSAQECFYSMFFGELTNPFNLLRQLFAAQDRKREAFLAGLAFIGLFIPEWTLICTWVARFFTHNPE